MAKPISAWVLKRGVGWFFLPLFAGPFLLGLWGLLRKGGGAALLDFNAVVCAGDAWAHSASLYANAVSCPFGPRTPYVYPPPPAELMGWLQGSYGASFELILAGAIGGLALVAVFRDLLRGHRDELLFRAPFFCSLTGRALFSGNVSLLFHAVIFLVAVHPGLEALLLPIIVACAICKPTFAVYSALFLFLDRPFVVRLALAGASLAATAAYFAVFRASDISTFNAWVNAAATMGLALTGHSFLALFATSGLPVTSRAALYALFASTLLIVAGFARQQLSGKGRVLLGVAVCVLINPRMMYYDHLTLPFGMGAVCARLAEGSPRRRAIVLSALSAMWLGVVAWAGVRGGEILFLVCVALISACAFASAGERSE